MFCYIIVDYNSADRSINYIKNIISKSNVALSFIIVENGECIKTFINKYNFKRTNYMDNGFSIYHSAIENNPIFLIDPEENLGYAKGNNLGMRVAKEFVQSQYIIISNNDLKPLDEEISYTIFDMIFRGNEDVSVIGPQIIGKDGCAQSPGKKIRLVRRWIIPCLLYPLDRLFPKDIANDVEQKAEEGIKYRVQGSYMVCRASDLIAVDGFDENTFLYGEEVILSERLAQIGKKVYYTDRVSFLHEHDQTIGSVFDLFKKLRLRFESECYYYQQYVKESSFALWISRLLFEFYIKKLKLIKYIKARSCGLTGQADPMWCRK